MKALITGASSGIGRDMARYLSFLGYDLVIVARRQNLLEDLKKDLKTNVQIECMDVSSVENCKMLFNKYPDIDVLINNAGFGKFGEFASTDLDEEISMINTNVVAVQVLTKLYLQKMLEKNSGHILNVASIAGLLPGGPLMSTYYATKSYIVSMTRSISEELRIKNSDVKISALCPGPVNTNFNNVANVKFSLRGLESKDVAKYAIDKMLANKRIIIPGFSIKALAVLSKIAPTNIVLYMTYKRQKAKGKA
jgi:hypothetical protein